MRWKSASGLPATMKKWSNATGEITTWSAQNRVRNWWAVGTSVLTSRCCRSCTNICISILVCIYSLLINWSILIEAIFHQTFFILELRLKSFNMKYKSSCSELYCQLMARTSHNRGLYAYRTGGQSKQASRGERDREPFFYDLKITRFVHVLSWLSQIPKSRYDTTLECSR